MTTIKVRKIDLRLNATPASASNATRELAGRVIADIGRRAGARLPAAAVRQLAGRFTRAILDAKGR